MRHPIINKEGIADMLPRYSPLFLLMAVSLHFLLAGCEPVGCLGEEDGCVVPSPCRKLNFDCSAGPASVKVIEWGDEIPGGQQAPVVAIISPGWYRAGCRPRGPRGISCLPTTGCWR